MMKASKKTKFTVEVVNGVVTCSPEAIELVERKKEVFKVKLKKDTAKLYELHSLHWESNPRNAFTTGKKTPDMIELHDDNERGDPYPNKEIFEFFIAVQEIAGSKEIFRSDPIIVND